jgi:hypothetical protein
LQATQNQGIEAILKNIKCVNGGTTLEENIKIYAYLELLKHPCYQNYDSDLEENQITKVSNFKTVNAGILG